VPTRPPVAWSALEFSLRVKEAKLLLAAIVYPVLAIFWIFAFWALWTIARSFRSIADSLEQIARNQRPLID
jgi:hypothetical protein